MSTNYRLALITGGAKRIGRAIALELAKRGFDILLHYNRSRQAAEQTASEISSLGRHCQLVQADLTQHPQLDRVVNTLNDIEHIDHGVLVNNASLFDPGTLKQTDAALFDTLHALHLRVPFLLTRAFAANVERGHIINLVDRRVFSTETDYFAYTLSKKALYELTRMAARELAPEIRVNAIGPGAILPPPGRDAAYLRSLEQSIPLRRIGDLGAILTALRYLLDNPFVTGECLRVDGGEHLK